MIFFTWVLRRFVDPKVVRYLLLIPHCSLRRGTRVIRMLSMFDVDGSEGNLCVRTLTAIPWFDRCLA